MFEITESPIEVPLNRFDSNRVDLNPVDPSTGATSVFIGTVRNTNEGKAVASLEYQAYESMAIKEGNRILEEARRRFPVISIAAQHRIGHLRIGEIAIAVVASSPHRREAFQACSWVVDQVKGRVPIWKKEHYQDGLSEWIYCPHCEVSETSPPASEYYSAQTRIRSIGDEGMRILEQARILVIGVGGLGSAVVENLARMGIGHLIIVDPDRVSASNLARQILYTAKDLGRPKVEAAAERLKQVNPWIRIETHNLRVDGESLPGLISSRPTMVVDGTDNFQTKFLIHDHCFHHRIDLVQAGVYQYEGRLNLFPFRDGLSPCLRCLYPETPSDCGESCAETGILATTVTLFGTLQAQQVLSRLLGRPGLSPGQTLIWDVEEAVSRTLTWKRDPGCPLCGDHPRSWKEEEVRQVGGIEEGDIVLATEDVITDRFPIQHRIDKNYAEMDWEKIIDKAHRYVLVCRRGIRSDEIARFLNRKGFRNVYSLKNGMGEGGDYSPSPANTLRAKK